MGNARNVAAAGGSTAAEAVRQAFRERVGADRFAVWFGAGLLVDVDAAGREPLVTVAAGSGVTAEWLRRTFREDLAAAVRSVCGPTARIVWNEVAPDAAPELRQQAVARAGSTRAAPRSPRTRAAAAPSADRVPPVTRRGPPGLESFVVGPSNRMAHAASERAAATPGAVSPLVIHGPSGCGKTHLLEGICGRARQCHAGIAVVSLSAEQFTTGFLQALHGSGLPGFRRSCRSADLVVIDDLQFFVGKRATLVELQHTVDALHRQGRQLVFACDRELDALPGLGAELLTRLRAGMSARILPPDYDVRRGIVSALAASRGLEVPDDVAHYVATQMTRHARELQGAVNRLEATSLMLGLPITLDMAVESLADLVRSSGRSVRLADVEKAVCKAFGIEEGTLQTARRGRTVNHPRMLAMFLARKHTHAALADIGRYFGRRSHSTVIAAQKAVDEWVSQRSPIVLAEAEWDPEEAIRRVEDLLRAG